LTEFQLERKGETNQVYKGTYELTEDNLSALDTIKNNSKEINFFTVLNISETNIYGTILEDILKIERENKFILYKRNYDEYPIFNFMKALGTPGLELIDHVSIEKTDKVVGYMLKNLGKNILSGKNLTQISLPIYLNDERTMLEM